MSKDWGRHQSEILQNPWKYILNLVPQPAESLKDQIKFNTREE